jgi:hypothetical protein
MTQPHHDGDETPSKTSRPELAAWQGGRNGTLRRGGHVGLPVKFFGMTLAGIVIQPHWLQGVVNSPTYCGVTPTDVDFILRNVACENNRRSGQN